MIKINKKKPLNKNNKSLIEKIHIITMKYINICTELYYFINKIRVKVNELI